MIELLDQATFGGICFLAGLISRDIIITLDRALAHRGPADERKPSNQRT